MRKSKITRPVCFVEQNKLFFDYDLKQSISLTFLNDAMAISAKERPNNHTDKESFAAALSCIQTRMLTLLFPRKPRRSSPSPFISHRVLACRRVLDLKIPNCYQLHFICMHMHVNLCLWPCFNLFKLEITNISELGG